MRLVIVLLSALCIAAGAQAQEDSGPVCRVSILENAVDLPDDIKDGLVLLRVYVSASTSCVAGQVDIAAFPTGVCRKEPSTDLNDSTPMAFVYKPAVLQIAVTPGNLNSGVMEISSSHAGTCAFNTHVADCGTAVPPGGRCLTRDLTDAQAETQGAVSRRFNQLR